MYEQLDLYHRAFKAYKRALAADGAQNKLHKAICQTPTAKERLNAVRFDCEVDMEWVETIEKHLIYVEKAILENRQFILQQGEIQLIEKAKRVSKTSVEHLAHHSELITHLPKPGDDLLPDKIYVPENDSNFAVYENRFLYMLLTDLAEFVDRKYTEITEVWNKYNAELILEKTVSIGKRELSFALSLKEEIRGDAEDSENDEMRRQLKRIGEIQHTVSQLLQTPLMRDVSHAARIKPPITRTNVLKMDPNFKMTVALYDYLCAYKGLGYTVTELREELDRFSPEMEDDFSELVSQSSYLTRRFGGGLDTILESRWEAENCRRREAENDEKRAELRAIRQKLDRGECSAEEYIRVLEERNRVLEEDHAGLFALEAEAAGYRQELFVATEQEARLRTQKEELRVSLEQQGQLLHQKEREFRTEVSILKADHQKEMDALQRRFDDLHALQLTTMAQLRAVRSQFGVLTYEDDCSSKERFLQLEQEKEAFLRFFEAQWRFAKKDIRKNTIGSIFSFGKGNQKGGEDE